MTTRFLQRPRGLPGSRRPGLGAGQPEGRGDGDYFRFRRGGAGAANMSRFKFVGKRLLGSWAFQTTHGRRLPRPRAQDLSSPAFWRSRGYSVEEGAGRLLGVVNILLLGLGAGITHLWKLTSCTMMYALSNMCVVFSKKKKRKQK